jgi:hypothetical protein
MTYDLARTTCVFSETGGRSGWRVPTSTEMFSLVDTSPDSLPDGHPFQNVSGGPYWTSTVNPEDDQLIQAVGMFGGFNEELVKPRFGGEGGDNAAVWCVRGGQASDDDPAPAEQPAWSRLLSADGGCESQRFECVMGDLAVLDRETGLVWERAPGLYSAPGSWEAGTRQCAARQTGGRLGWRPPSVAEGISLVDPGLADLPAGHPFQIAPAVESVFFVTQTAENATFGSFFSRSGSVIAASKSNIATHGLWCVRGPGDGEGD